MTTPVSSDARAQAPYAIHRYPTHLIDQWAAPDGRHVLIRPVLPQDDVIAQLFVRQLSDESRYQRFLVGLAELPPDMLARFTRVDYRDHVALIAETFDDDREAQIGEARFVADAGDASTARHADFAIAVADGWHRLGVGSRLLRGIERAARANGIAYLHGDVLRSNRRALDFMLYRGFITAPNPEEPRLVRVSKAL